MVENNAGRRSAGLPPFRLENLETRRKKIRRPLTAAGIQAKIEQAEARKKVLLSFYFVYFYCTSYEKVFWKYIFVKDIILRCAVTRNYLLYM